MKGKMKKIYIYPYASFEIKALGKKNTFIFFKKIPKLVIVCVILEELCIM